MQAIIMAAGKGSRLGDLTGGKPKSFVEIKGKKLIEYNIRLLRKYGIEDIIIVTGYREECFRELLGIPEYPQNHNNGIRLVWNPFYAQTNVLGSFYMGMEYLREDFIYLHADTLCDSELFAELLKEEGDIVLPIDYKTCDEEAMKVENTDGILTKISKNISLDTAAGEFIGILKMKRGMIEPLKEKTREVLQEGDILSYFEGAIQKLMDARLYDIRSIAVDGRFWAEIDFLADYERAEREIPDNLAD